MGLIRSESSVRSEQAADWSKATLNAFHDVNEKKCNISLSLCILIIPFKFINKSKVI